MSALSIYSINNEQTPLLLSTPPPLPGVNYPYNIANAMAPTTCKEVRTYTVLSDPEAYR